MTSAPVLPARAGRRPGAEVMRGALLGNLHDAGVAILQALAAGDGHWRLTSPAMRERVVACLEEMRANALEMPADDKAEMDAIDWQAWENLRIASPLLPRDGGDHLVQTVVRLVPATIAGARRYRRGLAAGSGY